MTIVRPNRERDLRKTILWCSIAVSGMIAFVLLSYVNLVGLRHDLTAMHDNIETMKVENAELKNQYYQLTSNDNLERLAAEMGLVKDKNPQWVLASQY